MRAARARGPGYAVAPEAPIARLAPLPAPRPPSAAQPQALPASGVLRMIAGLLRATPALGALACGPAPAAVAFRGGAALGPENSLLAVDHSLSAGATALHVDLFLTADRVPVLSALPYVDPDRCRTLAGAPVEPETWLLQATALELQAGYRCGARPDPRFPTADREAVPIATWDELLALLSAHPGVELWAQVGWAPNVSHDPQVFAAEVLARWQRARDGADLEAELVVVADTALTLDAFGERAAADGVDLRRALSWPRVPPEEGAGLAALGLGLGAELGLVDPVAPALDRADALILRPDLARPADARAAAGAGLQVLVGPILDEGAARAFGRWPVDALLVAHPGWP